MNWHHHHFLLPISGLLSSGSTSYKTKFYFADVTGDGQAEKIYWKYDKYGGDVRVFQGGPGLPNYWFSTSAAQSSGSSSTNTQFYFADVNGDGKSDKIYWKNDSYGGNLRVFLATSGGYFSTTAIQSSGSSSNKTKFYFADVNGDGMADKIYRKYDKYSGDIRVFLATGSGSFSSSATHSSGSTSTKTKFYFGDIDGNGKVDKVYWKYDKYSGDIRVFLATSNGGFSSTASHSSGSTSTKTKFFFNDMNGDGKADKIYWKYDKYNGDVRVYSATYSGLFLTSAYQFGGNSSSSAILYFSELNNDNKSDNIQWDIYANSGNLLVYLN